MRWRCFISLRCQCHVLFQRKALLSSCKSRRSFFQLVLSFIFYIVRATPSMIKELGLTSFYYSGDASKPSTQTEIKRNFRALLNEPYSQDSFCKNNPLCIDSNIEIFYNTDTGRKIVHIIHPIHFIAIAVTIKNSSAQ